MCGCGFLAFHIFVVKEVKCRNHRVDFFSFSHGTEVAGLFAAVANNSMCAFGVAYNATLGGELTIFGANFLVNSVAWYSILFTFCDMLKCYKL